MDSTIITDGKVVLSADQTAELWELGNAGANRAASALSALLGTEVSIQVPAIFMVSLHKLQDYLDDSISGMVLFQIRGQVKGQGTIILHVPRSSIMKLSATMLGQTAEDREIDEMDRSMLHEIGNIMTSSYLDACADLLSLILLPSPPSLVIDMPHAILESVIAAQEIDDNMDEVLFFQTGMHCAANEIQAGILLLPGKNLLNELLSRFRQVKGK